MERYRFGRVVVKVGSNVLTRDDGTLDTTRMSALSDQIAQLHRGGVEIILVSSGAVAAGRSELGTASSTRSRRASCSRPSDRSS